MKIIFCTLFIFGIYITISAQSKQDYIWFFGKDQNISQDGIQGLMFDFNQSPFKPVMHKNGIEFDQNNASICDKEGKLLFYTNGCAVSDRSHQIMPNGDSLNYGNFFDLFWLGDCGNGYPGRQDIIILNDPSYSLGYFIIHKTQEYNPSQNPRFFFKYLKYSYVDMALNNGQGDITIKNKPFHESRYLWSYLTAINHLNGKDWWIIQPKQTEELNYIFLLDENGFRLVDSTSLGNRPFTGNTSAGGDAKFSPDGTKYAFFNYKDALYLYDFDRSNGKFSNFRTFAFEQSEKLYFSSVEFSPSSRFVYLSITDSLFQIDLWEDNLEDGKILIDTYDGVQDPFSTSFFTSTLAPDCKIYIRPGSGSYVMHVINRPDEKGLDCDFVERGLRLPQPSSTGTFPNFPRYRVDEEEVCDPTISTFMGSQIYIRRELDIYPNPVSDYVNVSIPDNLTGYIYVYDILGREVITPVLVETTNLEKYDLSSLKNGYYTVEFVPKKQTERILYNKVIIKV